MRVEFREDEQGEFCLPLGAAFISSVMDEVASSDPISIFIRIYSSVEEKKINCSLNHTSFCEI